jgi:hypothetical protein
MTEEQMINLFSKWLRNLNDQKITDDSKRKSSTDDKISDKQYDEEKESKIKEFRDKKCNDYYYILLNHNNELYNNKKFENKIFLNYNDKLIREINLDFNDKMGDILGYILSSIGLCHNNSTKIYERKDKSQTTKDIIENPMIENHFAFYNDGYLFLEYNNKKINFSSDDIHKIGDINGLEFGLKNGDVIYLKLNDENIEIHAVEENISLLFTSDQNKAIFIDCKKTELISEIINRYRLKTGDNFDNYFFFNSKNLILTQTVAEIGLSHHSKILVEAKNNVRGNGIDLGQFDFVDVKTGKITKLKFDKNAPKWRLVKKGLNIFGICENRKCEAYKKEVIHIIGLDTDGKKLKVELNKNYIISIKCPICNKIIETKTCGFYKCEYQFAGKMIKDGEVEYFESEPKETKSDDFEYFDPKENGKEKWLELIIYVLPKQKIKYKNPIRNC